MRVVRAPRADFWFFQPAPIIFGFFSSVTGNFFWRIPPLPDSPLLCTPTYYSSGLRGIWGKGGVFAHERSNLVAAVVAIAKFIESRGIFQAVPGRNRRKQKHSAIPRVEVTIFGPMETKKNRASRIRPLSFLPMQSDNLRILFCFIDQCHGPASLF